MNPIEATAQVNTLAGTYDVEAIRADFPALHQNVHGKPLAYLDNGASAQKPRAVIDATVRYYEHDHSNVHRGVHTLSQRATDAFESAREKVRRFINAASDKEIIYVRGTTEGINLVARSYGDANLTSGDEIIVTEMEHHANIVPWQMLCERTNAKLRVLHFNDVGELDMQELDNLLSEKTRLFAVTHISNALGTINPIKEMTRKAHDVGAVVIVDGAQAVPHMQIDVQDLDCDFYTFSSHKMYGPTGIGILYGKQILLDAMPPYEGGGEMIKKVTFEKTTYADLPHKFEAGTPSIAQTVGLGAAVEYLTSIGLENIATHEQDLLDYANVRFAELKGLRIYGTAKHKASLMSFGLDGIHPHDIGTILDFEGVAVRTGHHCAQPVMQHYGIAATARASFGMYNTREEIDVLFAAIEKTQKTFAGK